MKPQLIKLNLRENSYNIYLGHNIIKKVPFYIRKLNLGNFGLVITSSKIYYLHKKTIRAAFRNKNYKVITVADGEGAKSKKWLFYIIKEALKADGWNKRLFIVCLGGGTIGDLGGFAASIYKRGIPYIQIPTTLLGQIDSSIGGKTGIDLDQAKNILGAFYQPRAVFIDPGFLTTLSAREIKQGMAEAIKYGVIKNKRFFYFLKNNHKKIMDLEPSCILKVISVCAQIKAKIVTEDEKEKKGLRTILNFGHTFAHALESTLNYKKISHGEAVALGMIYAAKLSLLLKECSKEDVREISEIIELFSLPAKVSFSRSALYKSLIYDKKFISGKVRMVLLKEIGKVKVKEGIPLQKMGTVLSKITP